MNNDIDGFMIGLACVMTGLLGGGLIAMMLDRCGVDDEKITRFFIGWAALWCTPPLVKLWLAAVLG